MLARLFRVRSDLVSLLGVVLLAAPAPNISPADTSQTATLHLISGDPADPRQPAIEIWIAVSDRGEMSRVEFENAAARSDAGRLVDRRVILVGAEGQGGSGTRLFWARAVRAAPGVATAPSLGPEVEGNRKWLQVLCQSAGDPQFATPAALLRLFANQDGGLDHYFREVSGGRFSMQGTVGAGWYQLPKSHAGYGGGANFDLLSATRDCLTKADPDVHLPDYTGIVFQFTGPIGASGYGGPITFVADGLVKRYAVAWISGGPPTLASYSGLYAHEIGHGLGLLHSYQKLGADYGSRFDVMSGTLFVHPISYQKSILGWIAPDRIMTLTGQDRGRRIALTRSALSPVSSNPVLVRIPLASRNYLTVEARQNAGYDRTLPNFGVVIHQVAQHRGPVEALLLEPNDDPDDGGIAWRVGERFDHVPSGTSLSIDSVVGADTWITVRSIPELPRSYDLAMEVTGSGTVREQGGSPNAVCSSKCAPQFVAGDLVRLEADPDSGMAFQGWGGDCAGMTCELRMDRHHAVTAGFGPAATVAVEVAGRGRVTSEPSGIACDWRASLGPYHLCGTALTRGSMLELNAVADSGSYFDRYSGIPCQLLSRCSFSVPEAVRVEATFAAGPTLNFQIVGAGRALSEVVGGGQLDCFFDGGAVGCNPGFRPGTRVTLAAEPLRPGTGFVGWEGACRGNGPCELLMNATQSAGAVFADQIIVRGYDQARVREAPFRSAVPSVDSTQVLLGGPGATTWSGSGVGSRIRVTTPSGGPFEWLRWERDLAGLAPGWWVEAVQITAAGSNDAPFTVLDSLLVRADASLLRARAGRVDSIVQGAPDAGPGSAPVEFSGPGGPFVPWLASSRSPRVRLTGFGGTGPGTARWDRIRSGLAVGTYLDSIVVRADGARDGLWHLVDSVVVVARPSRERAVTDLLGGVSLNGAERTWLDQVGNRDQQYNLGDLLALLDRDGRSPAITGSQP